MDNTVITDLSKHRSANDVQHVRVDAKYGKDHNQRREEPNLIRYCDIAT